MSAPILQALGNRRWMVVGNWRGHDVVVPDGFVTDLASIPSIVEPIMHRNEYHWIVAGIIHDWLYHRQHTTRSAADKKFRQVALAEGAPRSHAWLAWAAVRVGGWKRWRRK